jgi:hypothetical protein
MTADMAYNIASDELHQAEQSLMADRDSRPHIERAYAKVQSNLTPGLRDHPNGRRLAALCVDEAWRQILDAHRLDD